MSGFSLETIDLLRQKVIDLGFEFGPKLLLAVAIVIGGILCARWLGRLVDRWLGRLELEPPVRTLLLRILRLTIVAFFTILALQNLGVQLLPLIAGLGVAGAGAALAMQGVLANLVAGFTIIFTKPFRVGEYVAMVGVEGCVEAIDLFATRLSHTDRSQVLVPNRKIIGEILHNYGKIRQLDLRIGVAYSADLKQALAAIHAVLAAHPRVLTEPKPVVGVTMFETASIQIAVAPWIDVADLATAGGEINQAVLERLREVQVEMPVWPHALHIVPRRTDARPA